MAVKIKNQVSTSKWCLYNGDCCQVLPEIPSESVGFSLFSPPFVDLFSYSDSIEDIGNSKSYEEFFTHFEYLAKQLKRVIIPGRVVAVHCMDLPMFKRNGDEIGQLDFPGDIIRCFQKVGFTYHSRHCIWKDPLVAATRTRAIGLAHKQIVKDSAICRTGIPDYIVAFRKKGENPKPIRHSKGLMVYHGARSIPRNYLNSNPIDENGEYEGKKDKRSHWIWQQYASPVWFDIRQGKVLPYRRAREQDDERHICLARGSLVLTYDGYKPIQDLVVGENVLTHEGRWRPIIAKACMGKKLTIRITAQGVADLRLTPDHKIWTRYVGAVTHPRTKAMKVDPGWVSAEETKASYVNLKLAPIVQDTPYSLQEWWIVGRWLADGHFDCRDSVHISCGEHKLSALIEALGDRAGFVHDTGTSKQIRLKDAGGKLREILNRCGRGAANKRVPGEALSLNAEYSEAFLSGYLSGDGHYVAMHDRWTASSVSRSLLLGMAMVAQRARNTVASVYAGRKAGKSIIENRTVNCLGDWIFITSPRNKSGMILEDGAWKKVRGVTDAGKAEVWDIQVAEDASFTAEGCIVKNCPLQLDVIERCLELWSAKNDVVLSPFAGVGSEVFVAVKNGRKGIGIELKESYFRQAVRNLKSLSTKSKELV